MPAPATPPLLTALIVAHKTFLGKKRKEREQEYINYLCEEADAVDRRVRQRRYLNWLVATALHVDWNADPCTDLN